MRWLEEGVVREIVMAIKARGLDGIGSTEHEYPSYGFQLQEMVEKLFPGEVIIVPGQEVSAWPVEIVELYLPGEKTFRFLAHPGYPPTDFTRALDGVQGIEVANGLHNYQMDQEKIRAVAQERGLLLLTNSDAHGLQYLGEFYNEIDLEELARRAVPSTPKRRRVGRV